MAPARVRLLTRVGCTLCVDAERIVERVCTGRGVGYELVDVDTDEALRAEYTDHVPVLIVDGKVRSYWFVDEAALASWM
ncbi:glutaredoxin family protein [Tessaracoccus oleiagri]|uniref:Glutaredoxin n=1 Tax=Tessaracoccus oleiagri TaxID=686624 RepID=A0A1G9MVS3_9ACTN|nr:glutaredoxin family protein [Tessaracoccus oleiagri]SDL78386.1 Glutaredoxin [Tessaracoccus oleiagri]